MELTYDMLYRKVVEVPLAPPPGFLARAVALIPTGRPAARDVLAVAGASVLAAGTAYAAWQTGRKVKRVCLRLRAWWRGPPKVVPLEHHGHVPSAAVVPESAVAGSYEYSMRTPKGQALVGFGEGADFRVAGCAVRLEDWLLVPDHVLSALGTSHPITIHSGSSNKSITLTAAEIDSAVFLDSDILALPLGPARFSDLGLPKMVVASSLPERSGAQVTVVGAFGKGTSGVLLHSNLFGRVDYNGSTFVGYSGAAYCQGSQMMGIHLNGGSVNSGYSASYLYAMCRHVFRIVDEGTAEWLESLRRSRTRVVVDESWQHLDDVRIRVGGRYHIVERSALVQSHGDRWQEQLEEPGSWRREARHYDPESAEPPRPLPRNRTGEASARPSGASAGSSAYSPCLDEHLLDMTPAELNAWWMELCRRRREQRGRFAV